MLQTTDTRRTGLACTTHAAGYVIERDGSDYVITWHAADGRSTGWACEDSRGAAIELAEAMLVCTPICEGI